MFFAGVEAEYFGLVAAFGVELGCCCPSAGDGLGGVGRAAAVLADLYDVAAAVPTVWREELVPERVIGGQGYAIQRSVR